MRLRQPRVAPVADDELTPYQREVLAPLGAAEGMNIFRTLVRSPKALKRFLVWGNYVLYLNSLPARERELIVLRIGYLCGSGYEWAQHVPIALEAGLTGDEIARIKEGAEAGWSPADAAILRAVDELHHQRAISEPTWAELARRLDERQRLDLVFTTTQYAQVSTILNALGVQLDAGQTLDPDLQQFEEAPHEVA